jgi:hypothetical protein
MLGLCLTHARTMLDQNTQLREVSLRFILEGGASNREERDPGGESGRVNYRSHRHRAPTLLFPYPPLFPRPLLFLPTTRKIYGPVRCIFAGGCPRGPDGIAGPRAC